MKAQSEIRVSLPTYVLGEVPHRVAEAAEILPAIRQALVESGVDRFWSTRRQPWELAAESASRTLDEAAVDPGSVDVLLYATNSFWDSSFMSNETISSLMRQVGLTRAFPVGVNLARCANVQACLQQAAALIRGSGMQTVLIACVDKVRPGEDRLVSPKISVVSDAAASVLVSGGSDGAYELLDTVLVMDAELGQVDPEVQFSEYLSGVTRGLTETLAGLFERAGCSIDAVQQLLPNNYNTWITRSMAKMAGFSEAQVYLDNVGRVAHAVAGDNLINLRDYSETCDPRPGDLVVLLASGPSQWGATLLRRVPS